MTAAVCAACCAAHAQDAGLAAALACPHAAEVTQQHLLGMWRAEFESLPQGATLLLERHGEQDENLHGAINRNGERAELAGDVDDGEFNLEESADGISIDATWTGEVVEGSCGREIRGTWRARGNPQSRGFVLRKQ
ncbi:MAG: hypothetical protein ABIR26_09400 [Ramlibacter sp.]